jgi:hypothetical protein
MMLIFSLAGLYCLYAYVWPAAILKSVQIAGASFLGFLITGAMQGLRPLLQRPDPGGRRREKKIRDRIANGVNIVSGDPQLRCRFCSTERPVEDYVDFKRENIDPWIRKFGDQLARCPHNPKHVYHVVHFAENDWLCPVCNRPLFPDLTD